MKKYLIRALCLLLAIAFSVGGLVACSSKGKTMLELDGVKMSQNTYMLLLSRLKGQLASANYYGTEALTDRFWDSIQLSDGTTREEYYKDKVLSDAKLYVAALSVFEELELELPKSYIEEIDKELDELIEGDAEGSKNTFNSILADFGANYKILRDAYIMEAKISYLQEYLYGANGSKLSETVLEEYYQNNYRRFKHVFIYTYDFIYETDSDGNDIYYADGGKIAYDTEKGLIRRDAEGNEVRDENGDVIRENADGEIAYDKKNGKRQPRYDDDGNALTRPFTEKELIKASDDATLIMEKAVEGNYTLFDELVKNYSEDSGSEKYTNGYYVTKDSNYDSPEVLKALFEMNEGEVRRVTSDYGIHIVMRYETEVGGYADEQNSDFFVSSKTGAYVFAKDLITQLFGGYLAPYVERVSVDEELYTAITPKSLGANFYY